MGLTFCLLSFLLIKIDKIIPNKIWYNFITTYYSDTYIFKVEVKFTLISILGNCIFLCWLKLMEKKG